MKTISKTLFAAAAMTLALSASAATIELTTATAYDIENNDGDLAFAKFDATKGTLTGVTFELFNVLSGTVTVKNLGASGTGTFSVVTTGQLEGDVLGSLLNPSYTFTKNFSLAAGQSETQTLLPWTVSSSVNATLPSDLSAFIGNGDYHALLTGSSFAVNSGSGNASYTPLVQMDSYAKVTYTYTAAPVPEPETYAMMLAGLGLVGAMTRRRKSA